MKNTYYFPHDYHARHDPKLEMLFFIMGYEGLGIYWCLIERLYEQGGYLSICELLMVANGDKAIHQKMLRVIKEFKLFEFDKDKFWSVSCLSRLEKIVAKKEKATTSARKRWDENANAMPTQCDGNANPMHLEEKKEEEIRINTLVSQFFDYFTLKTKKNLTLNAPRAAIIKSRLQTHTIDQLKQAVDAFVQDTWPDRHKYIDIVYCIGIRNKVDNLERWLNTTVKKKERGDV